MNYVISKTTVAFVLILFVQYSYAQTKTLRPLTVDDALRLERLAKVDFWNVPVTFSPDGDLAAYTLRRSPASSKRSEEIRGKDSDIWLVSLKTNKTVNLTNGAVDGASSFFPVWSPDGQRMAFLSNRGEGQGTRLWVWDRNSDKLKMIGERPVVGPDPLGSGIHWLTDTELIYLSRKRLAYGVNTLTPATVWDSSQKVLAGKEPTASVLNSGTDKNFPFERKISLIRDDRLGDVVHVDAVTGVNKKLAEEMCGLAYFSTDRSKIACLSKSTNRYGNRLQIIGKEGSMVLPQHEAFNSVDWYGAMSETTWSPSGRKLSFVAVDAKGDPQSIYIFDLHSKQLKKLPHDRLIFPEIKGNSAWAPRKMFKVRWLSDDKIAVYAGESAVKLLSTRGFDNAVNISESKSRLDWWLIDEAGGIRNLTAKIPEAPAEIYAEDGATSFVGLSEGRLWRIPSEGGDPVKLFNDLPGAIAGLSFVDRYAYTRSVVAAARSGSGVASSYLLDLKSGKFKGIKKPRESAELRAISRMTGAMIFAAEDRNGSYLWATKIDEQSARVVHETNTFLKDIDEAKMEPFEYRNGDGKTLTGWIVLPLNYQPGRKYPVVTRVHGGETFSKTRMPDPASINEDFETGNPQFLAAQGYAVLFPSMPLPPIGSVADPLLEHTKNVLPAVDKVIEMGIADPDKLAVMGCSYGGLTTYGLITQTNRFKAAIAIAGQTDLVSGWGILEGPYRYSDYATEQSYHAELAETGQGRMMNPPWKDHQRYIRNSPFSYVDRVNTPVLMIHGDLDTVPMQEAELFFTGLYRQGKRARFVRYFGEFAHCSCESPANTRHMVKEIFAWLDEYLDVSRDVAGNMIFKEDTVSGWTAR